MTSILFSFLLLVSSFYSQSVAHIDGGTISMESYVGKKVLIVNIASESPYVSQLGQLQSLRQQFGDSVVILAVPSDRFGHEPLANSAIKALCQNQYGATYALASKSVIHGTEACPLYNWLTRESENGSINQNVVNDFQKFLVDKEGNLVGAYAPAMSPTDPKIINALHNF